MKPNDRIGSDVSYLCLPRLLDLGYSLSAHWSLIRDHRSPFAVPRSQLHTSERTQDPL